MSMTVCASDFIKIGNYIWFVDLKLPYLCCYSEGEDRIIRKVELPRGKSDGYAHYESIIYKDKYIIGIPYLADSFFRYNIDDDYMEFIKVPWLDETYLIPYYSPLIQYNGKVYIFRKFMDYSDFETNRVVVLDIDLFKVESFIVDIDLEFDDYGIHGSAFRKNFSINDYDLFILRWDKKMIVDLNLRNNDTNIFCPKENTAFETITAIDEKTYYLSDKYMNIWLWDGKNSFKKFEYELEGFNNPFIGTGDKDTMGYSLLVDNKIYLFPAFANMILEYDYSKNILHEAEFSKCLVDNNYANKMGERGREYIQFSKPYYIDGKIYIWNLWNKKIYIIEINSLKITSHTVSLELDNSELYNEIICRKEIRGFIEEHDFSFDIGLDDFIKCIINY